VVLDIRSSSSTFKKKIEIELTSENGLGVLIQGNLAHGFQATSDDSVIVYNLSSEYNPQLEYEINPQDKEIDINWPISNVIISPKDLTAPNLNEVRAMGKLPK
jgi:dTDP-4-dehydrorhamnose 3,5-epimerase